MLAQPFPGSAADNDPIVSSRNPTVAEVAALAGVSAMTVSRVVNSSARVSPHRRQRVENALRRLGYVPNQLARSLVAGRLGLIALIVPDVTHPFFTAIAHAVEVAAGTAGTQVILANSDDDTDREAVYLDKFAALRVDGVILAPAGDGSAPSIDLLRRRGIPVTLVDRSVDGIDEDLVQGNSRYAAATLTEHLAGHGHTRVAIISGPSDISTARERVDGFTAAMRRRKLPIVPDFVRHAPYSRAAGEHQALELLRHDDRPTAVLTSNSFQAFGVMDAARTLELKVPEDLALATFDNPEAMAVQPFLTSVDQHPERIAQDALRLLLARMEDSSLRPSTVSTKGTLHLRRSCGCPSAPAK